MITYSQRAAHTTNQSAKQLFELMDQKQSNLCVAADVANKNDLLQLADQVGPHICMLKTHIDVIHDFDTDLVIHLKRLSEKHNFLIFEDRKFADIGNTVKLQFEQGIYHISDWADIVNCHIFPGPGIIEGIKAVADGKGQGLLLIAQMSSKDNMLDEAYTKKTVELAQQHKDIVIGFISQEKISDDPAMLHMTPGVRLGATADELGQQYNTPEAVIARGSDVIIVGRGIHQDPTPTAAAQEYQEHGWRAYQNSLN